MESLNFHPIENSSLTAEIVVPMLIDKYKPDSVLDLGCNTGQWLKAFIDRGITHITGIDGHNMKSNLVIQEEFFIPGDISKGLILWRHSLVLCLEVAEHLPGEYADLIVETCCFHADNVFWSAATPGQTGYNHVNEQPHEYWIEKFTSRGYKAELMADKLPILPHDYYRKNAISFVKNKKHAK